MKVYVYILCAVLVIVTGVYVFRDHVIRFVFLPTNTFIETRKLSPPSQERSIITVAHNLSVPWGIARISDTELLVTERGGTLVRIDTESKDIINRIHVPDVYSVGEGGLLSIALHPEFATNKWLYLARTTHRTGSVTNEVVRYTFENDNLTQEVIIISGIPGARIHNGSALLFDPHRRNDGTYYLYVTTGDASERSEAQNRDSLAGKTLRVLDNGTTPDTNPFGTLVYSYGHRNAQGLAWDDEGTLWATEHGRSGILSGMDEINIIEAGGNYGWPMIEGDETQEGMENPIIHSGPDETWAPGGIAYADGRLFFTGLRGQTLYVADIDEEGKGIENVTGYLREEYGRLRAIMFDPLTDSLLVSTSNTDGRGSPKDGDDKILQIPVRFFE